LHTFFTIFYRNDGFKNDFIGHNIEKKDALPPLLSTGENSSSLTLTGLELFQKYPWPFFFGTSHSKVLLLWTPSGSFFIGDYKS
jgi:hypothetical protein